MLYIEHILLYNQENEQITCTTSMSDMTCLLIVFCGAGVLQVIYEPFYIDNLFCSKGSLAMVISQKEKFKVLFWKSLSVICPVEQLD